MKIKRRSFLFTLALASTACARTQKQEQDTVIVAAPAIQADPTLVLAATHLSDTIWKIADFANRTTNAIAGLKHTSSPKASPVVGAQIKTLSDECDATTVAPTTHTDLKATRDLVVAALGDIRIAITQKAKLAASTGSLRMIYETEDALAAAQTSRVRAEVALHAICVARGVQL